MVFEEKKDLEKVVKYYMDYIKPAFERYVEPV